MPAPDADEPADLPEVVDVDMTDEERERLDAALERSMAQARAGQLVDADQVIHRLLARGP
ncbi:MAG: hypothetical protein IPJ34_17630 [Myxococcales bacterium]|nr:hypothetical protein [Myxococcales bacterium]